MKMFNIIIAVDDKNGIGKNGDLAWKISSDLKYFKNITTNTTEPNKINAVVMGRKTWESIPEKFRPLPGRLNCILSRKYDNKDYKYDSLESCISDLKRKEDIEKIFIIGGANLYNQVLNNPMLDKIYLTKVEGDFDCDVFFDGVPSNCELEFSSDIETENDIGYSFLVYQIKR